MAAYLEITSDGETIRTKCGEVVTIGRDTESTLPIDDPVSSRYHALVNRVAHGQYFVQDMGSRNGTFVNEHRITTPTLLRSGDVIKIGHSEFKFLWDDQGEPTRIDPDVPLELEETLTSFQTSIHTLTILVADIRGYTALSERIEIADLTRFMSGWFADVERTVAEHGGEVDKFIGDCVMAVWDATEDAASAVRRCLAAALEIQELTKTSSRETPGIPEEMHVGVGINTGMAAVGIGSDSTTMGDEVNLAFRLEENTKVLKTDIVLSHSSFIHLPGAKEAGIESEIVVRGKSFPARIRALSFAEAEALLSEK